MPVPKPISRLKRTEIPALSVLESAQLAPWIAVFVELGSFPLEENALEWERDAVGAVLEGRAAADGFALFLDVNALPLRSSAETVRVNAAFWLPVTGLGVEPGKAPPRLWNEDDFFDRDYGTPLPPLMNSLLMMEGGPEASRDAAQTMIGSGALSILGAVGPAEPLVESLSAGYEADIQEAAFTGMPFYAPLLTPKMLVSSTSDQLDSWLGRANLYIRELPEEQGTLFLFRGTDSQEPFARHTGLRLTEEVRRSRAEISPAF